MNAISLRPTRIKGRLLARLAFCLVLSWPTLASSMERPNIVFVLADDLGYGDIKCFGEQRCQIETPHFDRLAREGLRFTDAHANASICVPTRTAIMTGRYPWRFAPAERGGPWGFLGLRFPVGQHTIGSMLQSAGYRTGYVGKWHLGTRMATTNGAVQGPNNVDYQKPLRVGPNDYGFNDTFILPGSLDMFPYAFARNQRWLGEVTARKGWSAFNRVGPAATDFEDTNVLAEFRRESTRFIADQAAAAKAGKPFFLYLALTAPHTPVSPSKEFQGKCELGPYGDFVMETDHCLGAVQRALDEHGLTENTLVIATSDHGPALYAGRIPKATFNQLRELEKEGHFSSGPYRGYKFSVYEGGHRVPYVVRWPGVTKSGGVCDRLIGLQDLMATLADVAGVQLQTDQGVDSISLLPLFKDPAGPAVRTTMIIDGARGRAFRDGDWKLCLCPGSGCPGTFGNVPKSADAWQQAVKKAGRPKSHRELMDPAFVQLFDLRSDPNESNDVSAKHPDRVRKMIAAVQHDIDRGRSTAGPKQSNGRSQLRAFVGVPPGVWRKR